MRICLTEQTGRQNRSPYFTFRGPPSEKYISTLISLQWDFNLLVCLHNFSFTFHNIRNCLPLPLLTLPAPNPPPPGEGTTQSKLQAALRNDNVDTAAELFSETLVEACKKPA